MGNWIMILGILLMTMLDNDLHGGDGNALRLWQAPGRDDACEVFIEWASGDRINIVYSANCCALGGAGALINVSGGIAVAVPGLKESIGRGYSHSSYPSDYEDGHKPILEIFADDVPVLKVAELGKTKTGSLGSLARTPSKVKFVFSGRLKTAAMDIVVEQTVNADLPRMLFSHIQARYTREVMVYRFYHQMVQANPSYAQGGIGLLTVEKGEPLGIDVENAPAESYKDFRDGLFYIKGKRQYVGFLSGEKDCVSLFNWKNNSYLAAYKILVEKERRLPGEMTESRGVSCWGDSVDEAKRLLEIAEKVRLGRPAFTEGSASPREKRLADAVSRAFGVVDM